MHKCMVCGNSSSETKHTRPEIVYHKLPIGTNKRKKWLEVLKIDDHCSEWLYVCSDHFLKENYIPGIKKRFLVRDAIPQPYDKKCDQNGFPNNEKPIENTVSNNFKTPRWSLGKIKSTRTDTDMNYFGHFPRLKNQQSEKQIPTVIETDVKPELTATKDHTWKKAIRCSIRNCSNRYSKDLSFFNFPSDFKLRKIWVEKCGLAVDPTKKVSNHYKVCSAHFHNHCFKNIKLKNRLRSDAVPSIFLNNGIIHARSFPSLSSTVNSRFVHVSNPSCSSSDDVTNMDYDDTQLLDVNLCCSIPGCKTNTDVVDIEEIPLFAPSVDRINDWSVSLGLQLTVHSLVCERHFKPEDMLYQELLVNDINEVVKSLAPDALPTLINDGLLTSNARNNVTDNADECST